MVLRVGIYALGLLFAAFGASFAINSELGVSPVTSFAYSISRVVGGGDPIPYLGAMVTVTSIFFMCVQIVLAKRHFMLKGFLQLPFSIIFGYFVDFAQATLGDFKLPGYIGSLGMLAIAIILIGIGLSLYITTDLVSMPNEGVGQVIAKMLKKPYHKIKIFTDCAYVAMSMTISLIAFGNINGLREGTVITALLAGRCMGLIAPRVGPKIRALCVNNHDVADEDKEGLHLNITLEQAYKLWQARKIKKNTAK